MKKPKSWIRLCVQLLLFIVFGGQALEFDGNPVTDDILKLAVLRQNIPKDYKIPVYYIPREEGGMCWVKLNVFYLEESLKGLSHKFGNISSNRKDISIIIEMLQGSRIKMGPLDPIMFDFQCHYREERWATARYFDFVKDFLTAAQLKEFLDDCEPPPCPTTQLPTTSAAQLESRGPTESVSEVCPPQRNCQPQKRILSEVLERSLLSLLFIPLLAIIFLLVWKLRSRRSSEDLEQAQAEEEHFTGAEASAPPLDADLSEKNQLNAVTV
ncbi:kit ligand a [Eucyclogobius newberryi]|uniref:kit ligand a n=1 Tax=Eucyclogobius newberryi TaxID=166745 RepID=UPI003B5CF227